MPSLFETGQSALKKLKTGIGTTVVDQERVTAPYPPLLWLNIFNKNGSPLPLGRRKSYKSHSPFKIVWIRPCH